MQTGVQTLHLSTGQFPDRDCVEAFREIFGRTILKIDMEPLTDAGLSADMTLRAFAGVATASGTVLPVRSRHLNELSDNDDPVLVMMSRGHGTLELNGRATSIAAGQMVLTANGQRASFTGHTATQVTNLRLSRDLLPPYLRGWENALRAPLLPESPALRLLMQYIRIVDDEDATRSPQLCRSVSSHVHELAALAIAAKGAEAELSASEGVRAARLRAIKDDIIANIGSGALDINIIAAHHGITPRYVRKLFEGDGISFSEFVLENRLARARRMLTSTRHAARMISSIAFDCGFTDLSYFNRTFRRRYGATPSDVRSAALGQR